MDKSESKLVKVTLAKPHKHGGKQCKANDSIEVRPDQAKWLKTEGVIK